MVRYIVGILIVLGIVGAVFAVVTAVGVTQGMRKADQSRARFENLKALYSAFEAYHEENWNRPGREAPRSWADLEAKGLKPEVRKFLEAEGYTLVLGVAFKDIRFEHGTSEVLIAYPAAPAWNGYMSLFHDSHVSALAEEEFQEKQEKLKAYLPKAVVLKPPAKPTP